MAHDDQTGKIPDGSYRYVRPESREVLYRDAGVESAQDAAQLPRCYDPPRKEDREKKENQSPPDPGKRFFMRCACMCLVCALLGGAAGGGLTALLLSRQTQPVSADQPLDSNRNDVSIPVVTQQPGTVGYTEVSGSELDLPDLYDMACEQVVGVTTEVTQVNFWGMASSSAVAGSGFVISEDGYILTNYHVIEAADLHGYELKVIRHDGTAYAASIVGTRPDNDIAVLQIQAEGLTAAPIGNSDAIRVGEAIHAVGNPMGELEFTMTNGAVSALDRVVSTSESIAPIKMFQIDAAVNSGNSGGPVYNDAGEVIGVVTAKYSKSGVEGLGFAIPINDAVEIASDLIAREDEGKAYLGVYPKTMSASAALYYNTVPGAYVSYVEEGSAADLAGILAGDVICQIGSIEIATADHLQTALRGYHAGDTVEIVVYRGEALTISVTLDALPEDEPAEADGQEFPVEDVLTVYPYRSAACR